MPRCQCLTNKGRQCFRNADEKSIYCFQHKDCKKVKKKWAPKVRKSTVDLKTKIFMKLKKPAVLLLAGTFLDIEGVNIIPINQSNQSIGLRVGGQEKQRLRTTGKVSIIDLYAVDDYENLRADFILLYGFSGNIEVGVQLSDGSYTDNFNYTDFIANQFDEPVDVFINFPEGTVIHQRP